MKFNYYILAVLFVVMGTMANAQETTDKESFSERMTYRFSVGTKIGGAAPMPIPREIRSVKGYSPYYPFFIGGKANYAIDQKWGVSMGLTFEGKGMNAKADVKGYRTTFNANTDPTQNVKGYYTGRISTNVQNLYLSIPIQVTFKLNDSWSFQAGPYVAFAVKKKFYGEATNGYLRNLEPTGNRVDITEAQYDFSESVRTLDVGMGLGSNYDFGKRYFALAQFDYGFNNIMKTGFETISFGLHNIFLNVGVGIKI